MRALALCIVFAALGESVAAQATPRPAQIDTFNGSWVPTQESSSVVRRLDITGTQITAFIRCGTRLCPIGPVEGTGEAAVMTGPARAGRERQPTELRATFRTSFREVGVVVSAPIRDRRSYTMRVVTTPKDHDRPLPPDTSQFHPRPVPILLPLGHPIPQLPLPLPRPTLREVLPGGLVTLGAGDTLGVAFDRLVSALHRAEVPNWSTFAIGESGFAIISQAEGINPDGTALQGATRWPMSLDSIRPEPAHSLREYLRRLFLGSQPGRYRVIVFAVTDSPLDVSQQPPSPSAMDSLLVTGASYLPDALRRKVLGVDGRCEVVVYEFIHESADDDTHLLPNSAVTLERHLVGGGFWPAEAFMP